MNELTINLNAKLNIPLYEQIYQYIKEDISTGRMACGEKMPSTRALAQHLQVSRSTIELAYEQLLSEGYIESVPCKGFFVCDLDGLYLQNHEKDILQNKVNQEPQKYRYDFSPYGIDIKSFPYSTWRKISKEILLDDRMEVFKSGNTKGEESLRHAIWNYLHQARGVNCDVEQIIVGAGNEHLLMLLGMILGYNHKIAFENPTYKQAYRLFENLSYKVASVDMDQYGMKVSELIETDADLAYVMPSHQYPLGIVMPMKRRMELLKWAAEEENRFIIEDDYDSEFRYKGKPIPALQGFDLNEKVIYLGTFSRAIAPAIRVSYMVLPKKLLTLYHERCGFLSCSVPKTEQLVLEQFLTKGHFERHLNKMRALYKTRHDLLLTQLKPLLSVCKVTGERAGVHLLLTFYNKTEKQLIDIAQQHKIKVYGLSKYDTAKSEKEQKTVILGYANMDEKELIEATQILCQIWK